MSSTGSATIRSSSSASRLTRSAAYYNACRHRGTRLAAGRGRVGAIICPFHGWRWNLDGSIRLVLDREEFVPRSDDDLGLEQVRVELWGGFVFITMDPHAEPLLEYLDPIPTVFAPFQFENMRYRWLKGVPLPCNWKTVLDGFLEAYHVPGTHPAAPSVGQGQPQPGHVERARAPHVVTDCSPRQVRPLREHRSQAARRVNWKVTWQGPSQTWLGRGTGRAPFGCWSRGVHRSRHACARERAQLPRR